MNKKWIALALGVIVLAAVWLLWPGQNDSAGPQAPVEKPADTVPADSPEPASRSGEPATDAAEPPDSSPFAVTDDDTAGDAAADDVAPDESAAEAPAPDQAPVAAEAAPAAGEQRAADSFSTRENSDASADAGNESSSDRGQPIEVPESYPVTEAARYFVPKEERRPGNLGGPPPLDFPGGPSDPNRANDAGTDTGIAPPPAPGQ